MILTSAIDVIFRFILGCIICLCSVLNVRGSLFWVNYFIARIHIHFFQKKLKKRFISGNLKKADLSPIDIGLISSDLEHECENPSKRKFERCDGVHFFGIDFEQNMIDLSINKIQDNMASVCLVLKLSNGDEYKLPCTEDCRVPYIDNEYLFHSCGLQIKCLTPLRKWRISFNGLLHKLPLKDQEIGKNLIHVKFSFVWLAMSAVQELNFNFNGKVLAYAFSNASCNVHLNDLHRIWKLQNRYEQWGQLMGTVRIDGKNEQDLHLWSARTRIMDYPMWNDGISFAKFYMYFKAGFPLKVENVSIANVLLDFSNGYTINGRGAIKEISDCRFNHNLVMDPKCQKTELSFKMGGEKMQLVIEFDANCTKFYTGPELQMSLLLKPFKVLMNNGDEGFGILHLGFRSELATELSFQYPPLLLKDTGIESNGKLVLMLNDKLCKSSLIAGGKGCSIALLTELSEKIQNVFTVPKGFVITTTAFEKHIKKNRSIELAIERLNDVTCQRISGDFKAECSKCIEEFGAVSLSEELRSEIQDALLTLYPMPEDVRFSVRSSACGEDSDDMSAAGQMQTMLGVAGIINIFNAVIKCWSSKYSFEAVQYARQNGQSIYSSMALVVQEMVPSETSGVMFTVDPVTGNPLHVFITANYGLGETVVSSLVEPDTIVLEKDKNNSLFILQHSIGTKMVQVHMKVAGGLEQKHLASASVVPCLSDEWAIKIGKAGHLVENCFCGPRDIEWAIQSDKLYLLQARPITTLHTETEFELIHDQDTPMRSYHEYWTQGNAGEIFLGATSPLGISLVANAMDLFVHIDDIFMQNTVSDFCPYVFHFFQITHKKVTLSIIDTLYRLNDKEISKLQKAGEVGVFGCVISTEEMHKAGVKKYGYARKATKWRLLAFMILLFLKTPKTLKMVDSQLKKFKLPLETFTNAITSWEGILKQMNMFHRACEAHNMASMSSNLFNGILLGILAKGKNDWDSEVFCDFATLLSSCSDVESADVPGSLQELSRNIALTKGDTFATLPTDAAYEVLKNDRGPVGKLFQEFLQKHGHRCVKELDLYSVPWGINPETLIPILQKSSNIENVRLKEDISIDAAVSKIKTPLNKAFKFVLKTVLPWSRHAVGQREKTKSMLIKTADWLRQSCRVLGKMMVHEGLLPEDELIFFLTLEEVKDILFYRKAGLVLKAIRRRRLHPKLNALEFPVIIEGIPKPILKQEESVSEYTKSFTLTGTVVCQGMIKARAKVILSLDEASTIQKGDVLITHATDTGWSPYFPLLSGVVTVLGGLISHGAVVAREYGLPCIVGVQNATTAFKTGDVVLLDGTKGTITKILDDSDPEI